MKQFLRITTMTVAVLIFVTENAYAQKDKSKRPSPPAQASAKIGDAMVTVDYSQPSAKGRQVFGELEKFGKVWRTGANENTTIEFTADVTIQGKKLAKGKYGLFTIPGEKEWTIIFNSKTDAWGSSSYNEKEDVLRVIAKSMENAHTEKFTISIDGNTVSLAWDKTKVDFKIKG